MSKILIIGNVLKDVYLKLDERQNDFEVDDRGVSWLELGFNGAAHSFFKRSSVFGGAAVSLSVLHNLGVDAAILSSKSEMRANEITWSDDPADYRYIFSHKNGITYFVPSSRKPTDWAMPKGTPEWILVDRSTNVSERLVDEIKNFLKFSNGTKLAVHAAKQQTPIDQRLAEMADLLFVEDEPPMRTEEKIIDKIELDQPHTQLVCHISPRKIILGEAEESWSLDRIDMMTHLTVYSTIVATVLGVVAAGGSPAEALLWARVNAEQASLEEPLSAEKLQELTKAELDKRANLRLITRSLMAPGRGILAIDESSKSSGKRLEKFQIANNRQNRHEFYRIMLTAPGLRDGINGVILSEDNYKQEIEAGRSLLEHVTALGIIPGIKADLGLAQLKDVDETHTLGQEGLAERLRDYYNMGFRFAKWRAAFEIAKDKPGFVAMQTNAEELANFAKECQLVGLVPVVETDILSDGNYTIEQAMEAENKVLEAVFEKLAQRHVELAGCLLKCNMISNGKDSETPSDAKEIGMATSAILRHVVPKFLAGVWLLSGGTEPKTATKNLTAVMQNSPFPWPMTYAFSRALEEPVLATWKGDPENIKAAQAALKRYLAANTDALHYLKLEARNDANGLQNIDVLDLS